MPIASRIGPVDGRASSASVSTAWLLYETAIDIVSRMRSFMKSMRVEDPGGGDGRKPVCAFYRMVITL
jgi:hypothetical protein